jgi:hypothetical protein
MAFILYRKGTSTIARHFFEEIRLLKLILNAEKILNNKKVSTTLKISIPLTSAVEQPASGVANGLKSA